MTSVNALCTVFRIMVFANADGAIYNINLLGLDGKHQIYCFSIQQKNIWHYIWLGKTRIGGALGTRFPCGYFCRFLTWKRSSPQKIKISGFLPRQANVIFKARPNATAKVVGRDMLINMGSCARAAF